MEELEAKYLLKTGKKPRAALRRLSESLFQAGYVVRPQGNAMVRDVYWDTPEQQILEAGWSLRSREADDSARLITAKRLASGNGAYFQRWGLEQKLPGRDPLPVALDRGPVADLVTEFSVEASALTPTFTLRNRRKRLSLSNQSEHPRGLVELVMDEVRIDSDPPLTFTEFEAELKQGPPQMLKELSRVFADQSALYPARVSKFQRGLQALGCICAEAPLPALTPDDPWLELCRAQLHRGIDQLREWEPFAWESLHPEGVHQMRVTCRKLRTTLAALEALVAPAQTQPLINELRWLTRALGPVRDLDVHLQWLAAAGNRLSGEEQRILERYKKHLLKRRQQAHGGLLTALASPRFDALKTCLDHLARTLDDDLQPDPTTVRRVAGALLSNPVKRLRKHGRRIRSDSPAEKLHRLRIDLKKVRYRLELIEPLWGAQLAGSANLLRRLQDTLGNHHDACVAADALRAYRRTHELARFERRVFRKLIRREERTIEKNHARFLKRWRRFDRGGEGLLRSIRGDRR